MARLNKKQLLRIVERSVHVAGWNYLQLSTTGEHPAVYHLFQGEDRHRVRVYIWNLTHGGRNRPTEEWRIQMTAVDQLQQEPGESTVILGWEEGMGVFAGFDYSRHGSKLGASPSVQIHKSALNKASSGYFSAHSKGNEELAIAFRPEFLIQYIQNLDALHSLGKVREDVEALNRLTDLTPSPADPIVDQITTEPRRKVVTSTQRALREIDFRRRVLCAYEQRCAMCNIQLNLLEGAHILPVVHPESTDATSNGVALCVLHHRAFDRSFVTFDSSREIHVNERVIDELRIDSLDGGLEDFQDALRTYIRVPADRRDWPALEFVETANRFRGWTLR